MLNYFPEDLSQNYEQMESFFGFMLENRGDYFKERIKELEKEAEHLQMQKQEIKEIITLSTDLPRISLLTIYIILTNNLI